MTEGDGAVREALAFLKPLSTPKPPFGAPRTLPGRKDSYLFPGDRRQPGLSFHPGAVPRPRAPTIVFVAVPPPRHAARRCAAGSELRVACNTRTVGLPAGRCAVSGEARGLSGAQAHSLTTPAGSVSREAPDGLRGRRPASASPSAAASSSFPLWNLPDGELNYPGRSDPASALHRPRGIFPAAPAPTSFWRLPER